MAAYAGLLAMLFQAKMPIAAAGPGQPRVIIHGSDEPGRLWQRQGKRAEARQLLAPTNSWCTEWV